MIDTNTSKEGHPMTNANPHASTVPMDYERRVCDAANAIAGCPFPKAFEAAEAALSAAGVPALVEENKRLREALEKLARLGNEPFLGNSIGNMIAQEALAAQPAAFDAEG